MTKSVPTWNITEYIPSIYDIPVISHEIPYLVTLNSPEDEALCSSPRPYSADQPDHTHSRFSHDHGYTTAGNGLLGLGSSSVYDPTTAYGRLQASHMLNRVFGNI